MMGLSMKGWKQIEAYGTAMIYAKGDKRRIVTKEGHLQLEYDAQNTTLLKPKIEEALGCAQAGCPYEGGNCGGCELWGL